MLLRTSFALVAAALTLAAQVDKSDPQRIRVTVQLEDKSGWRDVNPATVFDSGAHVRFHLSANFSGYLYVMNQGTAGSYELLFPRSDTGSDNRIEAGQEYTVPASQGWFRVAGPAGQDVIYWVISPLELSRQYRALPPPKPQKPGLPSSLRPRCDDTIFKSRGECIDTSAGVKPVKPGEKLPPNLQDATGGASRELLFMQEQGGAVLSSEQPLTGPVVYELRLAHR
jgi:hypothetical protein